jgi:hypothetical protein
MTSLPEFLLARIEEDEREANVCLAQYARGEGGSSQRWRRQLAECQAKRAIVTSYRSTIVAAADVDGVAHPGMKLVTAGMVTGLQISIQLLASLHSDHPDYRPEWANLKETDKP